MNQLLLLSGNPRRRRSGGKRGRSVAQRRATRRMLAARFSGGSVRRRRRSRGLRRNPISFGRMGAPVRSGVNLVKGGAIAGAGAIAADVVMGYGATFLPARFNADGSINWMYYAAKGGIALAAAMFAPKVLGPRSAPIVGKMAEGVFTVMSYEIYRSVMPAGVTLGFVNPARVVNGVGRGGTGRILNGAGGVGRILSLNSGGPGARVANRMNAVSGR